MFPTGTKGHAPWQSLAKPGGPLYSRPVFSTGTKGLPLVPDVKPGLKEGTFSPGLVLPVEKPELKVFSNREKKPCCTLVCRPTLATRLLARSDDIAVDQHRLKACIWDLIFAVIPFFVLSISLSATLCRMHLDR